MHDIVVYWLRMTSVMLDICVREMKQSSEKLAVMDLGFKIRVLKEKESQLQRWLHPVNV